MLEKLESKPFAKILKGPRIQLLRAEAEFAEALWHSILRDRELRGVSWPGLANASELKEYLVHVATETPGDEVVYVIFKDEQPCGSVHLHNLSYGSHKTELGYAIEKTFEGQGLVTEAIGLAEVELKKLGFNRVEIRCDVENLRSMQLARRNHFRHEGTLLQECIENGRFRDTAIFGKLLQS
jgi:RimJ/RimL family protein N-acetyltransferase